MYLMSEASWIACNDVPTTVAVQGSNSEKLVLPVDLERRSDATYTAVVVLLTSEIV